MRNSGFYRVRYLGSITVGEWDDANAEWYLIGFEKECNHITDSDLDSIFEEL